MKKFRLKTMYAAAAAAVLMFGISMAVYGKDVIRIIRQFTVGEHATFTLIDDSSHKNHSRPDMMARINPYMADKDGIEGIREYRDENGRTILVSSAPAGVVDLEIYTYFDTLNDVKPYLAFSPLLPGLLPDGFALDRIGMFNDENGSPGPLGAGKYLSVYFADDGRTQEIYMQIRLMDEETAFESSSSSRELRRITVNGYEGVVDGKSISVEIDGVVYMIQAGRCESVTQEDVIRMAESLM